MADDGRHIDNSLGILIGEGSQQLVGERQLASSEWLAPGAEPTYYDKPVVKPPVWIWSIPAYFFVGGVSGAAMSMGLAAQIFGGGELRRFEERCRWVGAIGGGIGSALLIHDLGRKERFLMMLRVFRATSPMSIGSWVLALATPASAGSALLTMAETRWWRLAGNGAGIAAGVLGMPLATYTSVLISNTAIPVWLESRRTLPWLFATSSMASMASVFECMPLSPREHAIVRTFGLVGRAGELVAGAAMEREAARVPRVARPLHHGVSGALWTAGKILTASSLAVALWPERSKRTRVIAGVLGMLGGLCVRFAVFHAGRASALDPRATFRAQQE